MLHKFLHRTLPSAAILCLVLGFTSIFNKSSEAYRTKYDHSIVELEMALADVLASVNSPNADKDSIRARVHLCRKKIKAADFWLRYLAPREYSQINAPLPIEWETEVSGRGVELKKNKGAGMILAELFLDDENYYLGDMQDLITNGQFVLRTTYRADTTTAMLNDPAYFYRANRLFLLNLATIYNTGFECPNPDLVIPELGEMLQATKEIYLAFGESYPNDKMGVEYLALYDKTIDFVKGQSQDYSKFNHFEYLRDYINPLYALNQGALSRYPAESMNLNDSLINNQCASIFDKSLYRAQNTAGVYSYITDPKAIAELKEVGKLLFFDPILSGNNLRSCASCHKPNLMFADTVAKALQFNKTDLLTRNTPSLVNVIFQHQIMLDGKHMTLLQQAKDVSTNPIEMNGGEKEIVEKVLSCQKYKDVFQKYLVDSIDYTGVRLDHIMSAIIMFYSDMSQYNSPFDEAINKKGILKNDEIQGFNLFMSKALCATCHFAPQFNGVKPPYFASEFEVIGVPNDTGFLALSSDLGRYRVFRASALKHAFRTNTVRNTAITKPYMYNGVFTTLEQVINFYDAGGGAGRGLNLPNQTLPPDSLKLTKDEKASLIAFIKTLNEDVPNVKKPSSLPKSSNSALNKRKAGGEY